ncbi:MAG: VOC family protein [Clostridiales bacterium]|nr:VOC family protein [Clostridiales bacterium]
MKAQPMIAVRDVPASARFYMDLLGAVSGHGGDEYEQLLVAGRLVLQLHDCRPDANHGPLRDGDIRPGNGVILWFVTDDFEAQIKRVLDMKVSLDREPAMNPFSRSMELWLHDPDGYQVVIAGPSAWEHKRGDSIAANP